MAFQYGNNLPKGTLFSAKQMRFGNTGKVQQNAAMSQILKNKDIARVLDKKVEQVEFLSALKKQVGEGKSVKKDDLRKVLGHFRSGRGSSIDKGEAQKMANQFFGGSMGKKYIFTNEKKESPAQDRMAFRQKIAQERKNNPVVSPRGGSSMISHAGSSSRSFTPRPRLF